MTARTPYAVAFIAAAVMLAPNANAHDSIAADPMRQAAEQYGQGICSELHSKPVRTALADADTQLTTAGFTEQEAGTVVAYSLIMFCRDEISVIEGLRK